MKNIDIDEWLLNNNIDPNTEIIADKKQWFLSDILEKHLKEQFAIHSVSNSASGIIELDTKIQLLPRKWWQLYKRGWQTHTDFFGRRYFVRYHWVK